MKEKFEDLGREIQREEARSKELEKQLLSCSEKKAQLKHYLHSLWEQIGQKVLHQELDLNKLKTNVQQLEEAFQRQKKITEQ